VIFFVTLNHLKTVGYLTKQNNYESKSKSRVFGSLCHKNTDTVIARKNIWIVFVYPSTEQNSSVFVFRHSVHAYLFTSIKCIFSSNITQINRNKTVTARLCKHAKQQHTRSNTVEDNTFSNAATEHHAHMLKQLQWIIYNNFIDTK